MKKLIIGLVCFTTSHVFASEITGLPATCQAENARCTMTAFGNYNDPYGGTHNVQCTQTASSCAEAEAAAKRCRDLNICNKVREYGGEPAPALNCPPASTFTE